MAVNYRCKLAKNRYTLTAANCLAFCGNNHRANSPANRLSQKRPAFLCIVEDFCEEAAMQYKGILGYRQWRNYRVSLRQNVSGPRH